ncbi:MAG: AsmA family protein [Flammeovirgaceae bacterium]|nr:AsmA family protein [Flammeovirgaceae bacterium]
MKVLKRAGIGIGILLAIIVAAGIIIPMIFKDDIKKAIDEEIAKSVNADVLFDLDDFHLTVFKNFPNATVEIHNMGVFNRAPFDAVPLFIVEQLEVEINLTDILFGDELVIKGITLVRPQIDVRVLEDGRANYDITYPSSDTVTIAEEPATFSFGINHWEIVDGDIYYDDKSIPFGLKLKNHESTPAVEIFLKALFDLKTKTSSDSMTISYDGAEYISHKRLSAEMIIEISEDFAKYVFKENTAFINDFGIHFDGWFKMNDANYEMDITYGSPKNTFKSILSLVPGMYTQDFDQIETKGDLTFGGLVKGIYSDTQMPAFNLRAEVSEAMFKYPDLPTPVSNIQMDLWVDNKDGIIENTVVDLKKLHLDFGSNPVDAKMLIENLRDYRMEGSLSAKLNLAEINTMFPVEGLEMKGNYTVQATVKGVYDSIKKIMPAISMDMSLQNGFVKSAEFPIPLENLAFASSIKNTSGKMEDTKIQVNGFTMMMDGEKFTAELQLENLADYTWHAKVNGRIDLEKMMKIYPIDGMTLTGKLQADFETRGKMSDLDAGRYDRMPTSGSASLLGFTYTSKDLPYLVTVDQSQLVFDPGKIELKNTSGKIGKSDYAIEGSVRNYIAYAFSPDATIQGDVKFISSYLDLNEFMVETEESESTVDTAAYGVIPVPANINVVLHSRITTTRMMDMTFSNATGDIVVRDGIVNLQGLSFNLFGGAFVVRGTYDPRDLDHARYDFGLKIENMGIQQAANSFSIVQTYAPIAALMTGKFNTDFKITGELLPDLMPNLRTVNGNGLINIAQAGMAGSSSKLVSGITALTKLDGSDQVSLRDVLMSATIEDGRIHLTPFNVKFGEYATSVNGSTGVDGSLDYTLKMNVPAGKLGSQFQGYVNQYSGSTNPNSEIPVTIALAGVYNDPKPRLIMDEQKSQVKAAVTEAAKQEGTKAVEQLTKGTEAEGLVKNLLGTNKTDSTKTDSTKSVVPPELQNKLQNLLKKKKNN